MVISSAWFVSSALLLLTWDTIMPWSVAVIEKTLSPDEWQRLRWQCRRGMLELDTLLAPFFDEALASQPARLQQAFVRLLDASDLELFRWLMRGEQPADGELVELIEVIREHRASTYPG